MPSGFLQASLKNGIVELNTVKDISLAFTEKATIIQPKFVGICRADIKEVSASRDIPEDRGPLFGHEFIGKVIQPGNCQFIQTGDYVTFNPNVTPKRSTAYSEYFFIEESAEVLKQAIIKVDENLFEAPWLPEPLACIVHSVDKLLELSDMKDFSDKNIGIIGAGNSGILFGFYMKYLNANVTLLNRGKMRLEFIKANHLFNDQELDELSNFKSYKDLFDIVIVVPTKINPDILNIAKNITKNNSFIHLYGGTTKDDKFPDTQINIDSIRRKELKERIILENKTLWVSGAYGCDINDFIDAIGFIREHNEIFPIQKMVSKTITLRQLPDLIMDMADEKIDFPGKVVVKI